MVAVADAVVVVVVVQPQASPMVARAEIPEGMDAAMDAAMVEQVAEPMPTSHLGAMLISHHAMMPILSRATTHNPPTTRHATSARAHHKSAIARAVAMQVAAWAGNAAKGLAHRLKVDNLTRCAPAWT